MKRNLLLLVLLSGISFYVTLNAQCSYGTPTVAATVAAPTTIGATITSGSLTDNQVYRVTGILAGAEYRVYNCGSGFDTQITIFPSGGGTSEGYNDDNGPECTGAAASINYLPTVTGTKDIKLQRYNCSTAGNSNGTVTVRLVSLPAASCTYTVPGSGSNSITTCSGTICDPGGTGNYLDNQNGYTVINPTAGNLARITGVTSAGEACCDYVRVYDGTGTGAPLLGQYAMGTAIPQLTSTTGPLTVQFFSDGSVTGAGFSATISCVAAPPSSNDACANAINISSLPYTSAVISNATATDDSPTSTCDGPYKNVWWKVTGICGTMTAITCTGGTNFDNEMAVFTGSCGSMTQVTCNDDNGAGCTSNYAGVSWQATAGTIYYISVGSYYSAGPTGNLQLNVTATPFTSSVAPTGATGTTFITSGQSTTLTVSGGTAGTGAIVEWFTGSCGGTSAGTGNSITVSPTTTTTYYMRYNGTCNVTTCGSVTVTVGPANDNVCSATALAVTGASPYNFSFGPYSNANSTAEAGEPEPPLGSCTTQTTWCNTGLTNTIWFTLTVPACGLYSIETDNFDTQIALYSAASCSSILAGGATLLAANDDESSIPYDSKIIDVALQPGVIYYLQLDSYTSGYTGSTPIKVTGVASALPSIGSVTALTNPVCGAATTTLTANGVGGAGATVTWWTGMNGTGTNLGTGTSLPNAGAGTYYARVTGNCTPAVETSITITSITPVNYYADSDGDTYGFGSAIPACVQPANTVTNVGDCNDAVFAINPGATEICNGLDDNCDTNIDEGVVLIVPTSPATYTSYSVNHLDGASNSYVSACNVLGQISEAPGGNVLGNTTISSVLSSTVPSPNADGYIYGRRKYTVNASSTGAATLKLYFTQADFDNYNSNNGQFLDLPTSGNNADPNKPYFRIARVSGGTYTISGPLGDFLTWNSTDSRWEVDYAVADINADYYFVSMASCDGIVVSGLQATNVQGSSLVATWNNLVTTPAWGWYSLQYKPVASGTWISAGTSNGGTTSKLIVGLMPGTAYEIQIRRHCSSQSTGPWSSSVFFTTLNPGCASPPVLTMSSINSNSATMTWPAVGGAGWFEFRYSSVSASGPWTSGGTLGGTATSKVFLGLSVSTTYYVQARVFCASNGQPSEWGSISFATPGASGCALPPVLTASTINATNVTVTWPAVGGAGWYEFRYKPTSSGTWITAGTLTGSAVAKLFAGLTAGTSYNIGARSFCSNGQPSVWGDITVTTAGLAGCELPPALNANPVNATNVTVNWPFITGAAWYEFRYKLTSSGTWITAGTLGGNAVSKIFSGLTPGSMYHIGARTFCSNGQPSAWSEITVSTAPLAGCELPPTLTAVSVGPTSVTLTWPVIGSAGWFEFRYSSNSPAGPWTSGGTITGTANSKVIIGLSPATTYYVQARTFCSSNGLPSAWGGDEEFMTTGAALVTQPGTEEIESYQVIADDMDGEISEWQHDMTENTAPELIQENAIGALTLYPNPTRDNLNVVFYPENLSQTTVLVLDLTGRILQQIEVETTEGLNAINIDLGNLPAGMYMIQLRENGRLSQVGKAQKLD